MKQSVDTIAGTFDYYEYLTLKRRYERAVVAGESTIIGKDGPILTDFAKYLLEFLEPHFKSTKQP